MCLCVCRPQLTAARSARSRRIDLYARYRLARYRRVYSRGVSLCPQPAWSWPDEATRICRGVAVCSQCCGCEQRYAARSGAGACIARLLRCRLSSRGGAAMCCVRAAHSMPDICQARRASCQAGYPVRAVAAARQRTGPVGVADTPARTNRARLAGSMRESARPYGSGRGAGPASGGSVAGCASSSASSPL